MIPTTTFSSKSTPVPGARCALFASRSQQIFLLLLASGNEARFINDFRGIAKEPNVKFENYYAYVSWALICK